MAFLVPDDLAAFADIDQAKAQAMIDDAEAMAALAAPCITDPEFVADPPLAGALRAVLRGAILRWDEAGSGAVQQFGAGSFGVPGHADDPPGHVLAVGGLPAAGPVREVPWR